MYSTIINRIKTVLETVTAVKKIYPYPIEGTAKAYPAVIFLPADMSNVYSDDDSNQKVYKFKIWIVVDLSGTDAETVFTSILPNVVDKVIQAFDTNWKHQIDNHRAWQIIDSGSWGMTVENNSKEAHAELSLTYRVSNDL